MVPDTKKGDMAGRSKSRGLLGRPSMFGSVLKIDIQEAMDAFSPEFFQQSKDCELA